MINKESIYDDPYGSQYGRAMDKLELSVLNTMQPKRVDLVFNNNNLVPVFFFNRINNDDISMCQAEFLYTDDATMDLVDRKYAEAR